MGCGDNDNTVTIQVTLTGHVSVQPGEEHKGDMRVTDEVSLMGKVIGKLTVASGGKATVIGIITDDIIVEPGGRVELYGMAASNVINDGGELVVEGMVIKDLVRNSGQTTVKPHAVIQGQLR